MLTCLLLVKLCDAQLSLCNRQVSQAKREEGLMTGVDPNWDIVELYALEPAARSRSGSPFLGCVFRCAG